MSSQDAAIVWATIAAGGLAALATIAGSSYSTWRSKVRETELDLFLELLPDLDEWLANHAIEPDVVRKVARRASILGRRQREYAEELFDFVWMFLHISDPKTQTRIPSAISDQDRVNWLVTNMKRVRDAISERIYFELQPWHGRIAGWPKEARADENSAEKRGPHE